MMDSSRRRQGLLRLPTNITSTSTTTTTIDYYHLYVVVQMKFLHIIDGVIARLAPILSF